MDSIFGNTSRSLKERSVVKEDVGEAKHTWFLQPNKRTPTPTRRTPTPTRRTPTPTGIDSG